MNYSILKLSRFILLFSFSILVISVSSNRALAFSYTFDFTLVDTPGRWHPVNLLFTNYDLTLEVTAHLNSTWPAHELGKVDDHAFVVTNSDEFDGIGVAVVGDRTSHWIAQHKHTNWWSEFLYFDFNKKVYLSDLDYTMRLDVDDDFKPNMPTNDGMEFQYAYDTNGDGVLELHDTAPTDAYRYFGIAGKSVVPKRGQDSPFDFAVNSLTVSDTAPSVVPLPAALPLYGAGITALGLIGWYRRRRQVNA